MRSLLQFLDRLLPDPQPALVFEIGDGELAGARRSGRSIQALARRQLPADAEAGPGAAAEALRLAASEILAEIEPVPSPHAAILLPDTGTRMMVFEFDRLPLRSREVRRAVEERFANSLPCEPGDARIAYCAQGAGQSNSVLATAASASFVRACEEGLEAAGLLPGYVGLATVSTLSLVEPGPMAVLVKVGGEALTIVAVEHSVVRLVRRIALPGPFGPASGTGLDEILADLFPTLVYIEENLGTAVSRLLLSGFGDLLEPALEAMRSEFEFPVDPLVGSDSAGTTCGAGLAGYVHG